MGIGARTHQRLDDLGVTRLGEIDRVHPTELRVTLSGLVPVDRLQATLF